MATTTTATTNFSSLVQETVGRAAEDELRSKLVHAMPGNYLPLRFIKGTNFVRLARYADLAVVTTALTEGGAPTDQELVISSEAFSATQIAGTIALSDLAQLDSPHDLFAVAADKAGRQAAQSIDVLVREIINAGTSVKYAGTATSRATVASSHLITGALIKQMVARLEKANVPTFGDGFYRAIIHPFAEYDLFTDTANGGWMDASKYVDNTPLLNGEIGRYHKVRFMVTSDAKVFTTAGVSSADVYSTVFLGTNAYGIADSQNLTSHFVPPGGNHADPVATKGIVGWKVRFGAMLVDEAGARYLRLEHGATLS